MLSPSAQYRLLKLARNVAANSPGNPLTRGVASKFFRISENFGLKLTKYGNNEDYMRGVYERQLQAWQIGLGPYCFGFEEYDNFNAYNQPMKLFGYITEIVPIHFDITGELIYQEDMGKKKQIKHMIRIFKQRLDFSFYDCHNQNVGLRGRKMLCIDFGND